MLLVGAIVAGITLAPGLQEWLKGVPFCQNSTSYISYANPVTIDCSVAVGYLAVYRICFALVCFFALMALMMLGAKSSRDARAPIQNGFWGIKYLIVIGFTVGAFFIPAGNFNTTWMWVGLIGGFAFILVQLVLIVDFAHTWAESWVGEYQTINFICRSILIAIEFLKLDNYNENESRAWYCALFSATGLQYILAIAGTILLYIYYDCAQNKFFITINLVLCVVVSVLSILPQVQEKFPRSGLLQSSVVTLYAVYLTWSALSNNPDAMCHTDFLPPDGKNKVRFDICCNQLKFQWNSFNFVDNIR